MGTGCLFCKVKNSGDLLHNQYTSHYLLVHSHETGEDGASYAVYIGPHFLKS